MEQNSIDNQQNESELPKGVSIAFALFVVAFLLWITYQAKVVAPQEFSEKIKTFNNGSTLVCHQMGSATLVSKQTGWHIYKEKYFLKDGTIFDIHNNCFLEA